MLLFFKRVAVQRHTVVLIFQHLLRLLFPQLLVNSVFNSQEFVMLTRFSHEPILQHYYLAAILDSRQTMRNHESSGPSGYLIDRLLNFAFSGGVERGGGFIKTKYLSTCFKKSPCDCYSLLLSSWQSETSLTHLSSPLLMLLHYKVVDLSSLSHPFNLGHILRHSWVISYPTISNIVLDGIVEENAILRHNGNGTS